ncbi:UdgX family uracil-DNA binding protein [Roseiarcaceae bacterium H3SJ34-1]|uniref:UdgX family uracil-DNA binding protein n=1 Tax=Terripilifer ovatus TaxID=3032367 RepID=UPI003AB9AE45|nr:UdgX family uracil-DNA binding protein [Roseiarcaceae bacterium H3SJ34-1]
MLTRIVLKEGADLEGFRRAVRMLLARDVRPDEVMWVTADTPGLFGSAVDADAPPLSLPRAVRPLCEMVVCHSDPERYALLHGLIHRIARGERALLEVASDPLVHRLNIMAKSVRRDIHKMHAFLRFRKVDGERGERFIAWFEPDHFIVEAVAQFFIDRYRAMDWTILTPKGSLHWDRQALHLGPPGDRRMAPDGDDFEDGWRSYYESTFNPARVNPDMMRTEMPKKYWRNMPETAAIPALLRQAASRTGAMIEQEPAAAIKRNPAKAVAAMADQEPRSLAELNRIIAASEPLVPGGTRAVLGEGPQHPAIAFVGEQPGDQEDQQGRPFVGPAGQLLDKALAEAGIDRRKTYLTNAVKHFKFEQRGKLRLHKSPTAGEVKHYRWWLMKELDFVRPKLVVALGATAVLALAGKAMPVTRARGPAEFGGLHGYITVHPSYLLRLPDAKAKAEAYAAFVEDLKRVAAMAA